MCIFALLCIVVYCVNGLRLPKGPGTMNMPVTENLAAHLDGLGFSMEELARRAGGGLSTWYRIRSQRKGWLSEATVAMLAKGLGISRDQLLQIAMGTPVEARGHPCAGKPSELADLCRAWPSLDESTRAMVLAVARAAVEKQGREGCQDGSATA